MSLTREEYVAAYGQRELASRLDRDNDGQEDAGVFDKALVAAETEVAALVDARPQGVPAPSDALLAETTLTVVRYKLFRNAMSPLVQEEYDRAMKLLTSVTNRRTAPAGSSGGSAAGPVEPLVQGPLVQGPARLFSRDTQRGL